MKVQEIILPDYQVRYIVLDDIGNQVFPINRYLKHLDKIGRSPNTIRSRAYQLKTYFTFLSDQSLGYDEIFTQYDKNYIEILSDCCYWLQSNLSGTGKYRKPQTINLIILNVLNFYRFILTDQGLKEKGVYFEKIRFKKIQSFLAELLEGTNRAKAIRNSWKLKEESTPRKYLTRNEFNQIFRQCTLVRDQLLLSLMFEGGLRIGETLGLRLSDLKIEENQVSIISRTNLNQARNKNNWEGNIDLPNRVFDLALGYILNERRKTGANHDYLFVSFSNHKYGAPLSTTAIYSLFKRLSIKTSIHLHPHMLRHGHGAELYEKGFTDIDIQHRLRHKSILTTSIYIPVSEIDRKRFIQKIQENNEDPDSTISYNPGLDFEHG